ncbi:MAG: hypothetical protein COC02_00265 [Rhodospirillaceae bacterium]|nr:MAG: hypothetical protein COC02_00265 [Rhodospirillaceae bacterium]
MSLSVHQGHTPSHKWTQFRHKTKHTPDRIGDVIGLSQEFYEKNPGTLDPKWREFSNGVFRLENNLMVVLDIDSLPDLGKD